MGFFCKRVKGGEVQKVHFLGPKGPHFGGPAPPQSILVTGLPNRMISLPPPPPGQLCSLTVVKMVLKLYEKRKLWSVES